MLNVNFTTAQRLVIVTILILFFIALLLAASNTAGFSLDRLTSY